MPPWTRKVGLSQIARRFCSKAREVPLHNRTPCTYVHPSRSFRGTSQKRINVWRDGERGLGNDQKRRRKKRRGVKGKNRNQCRSWKHKVWRLRWWRSRDDDDELEYISYNKAAASSSSIYVLRTWREKTQMVRVYYCIDFTVVVAYAWMSIRRSVQPAKKATTAKSR